MVGLNIYPQYYEYSFKYIQIKKYLEDLLDENKDDADFRLPSENMLAIKFNASRVSAKTALSILEKENKIVRIKGKGSFVNISKKPQHDSIDFFCLLVPNLDSQFIIDIVNGARKRLAECNGPSLMIYNTEDSVENEERIIRETVALGCRGFLIFPCSGAVYNKEIVKLLINDFSVVFFDRSFTNFKCNYVSSDNYNSARTAVTQLIAGGQRNIAFISSSPDNTMAAEERLSGYKQALSDALIPINEKYIYSCTNNYNEELLAEFLINSKITAAIVCRQEMCQAMYRTVSRLGISVPEKLSLVFYDDIYKLKFDKFMPFNPIVINQKPSKMGSEAAALLYEIYSTGIMQNKHIVIESELV